MSGAEGSLSETPRDNWRLVVLLQLGSLAFVGVRSQERTLELTRQGSLMARYFLSRESVLREWKDILRCRSIEMLAQYLPKKRNLRNLAGSFPLIQVGFSYCSVSQYLRIIREVVQLVVFVLPMHVALLTPNAPAKGNSPRLL